MFTGEYNVPIYTKVCVSGVSIKEALINKGMDEEKIVITGQPRFDGLINHEMPIKSLEKSETVEGHTNKKLILLTTQPLVEDKIWTEKERKNFIQMILQAMEKLDDYKLIIKIHPRENLENYKILKKSYLKKNIKILKDVNLYDLLRKCELLITIFSTTALEAMIVDKPVIIINDNKTAHSDYFTKSNAVLVAENSGDLLSKIDLVMNNREVQKYLKEAREQFVYQETFIQDGKASERVVKVIENILWNS